MRGHVISRIAATVLASVVSLTTAPAVTAHAAPTPSAAHLVSLVRGAGREATATVYSAAMDKDITLRLLIPPGDTPRPTVYLLDGVGGTEPDNGLLTWGRASEFYATKDVNVVATVGGDSSYFTDWKRDDPRLGRLQWATFLTEELPPIIDATLTTTKRNALVGVSMSGTSSLALAIRSPGLFGAVASFSGCAQTSDLMGRAYVYITVSDFGGNPENMWGRPDDPMWRANDPYLHADKLRGTAIYVANGTGLPGRHDTISAPNVKGSVGQLIAQTTVGGVIEAATNQCSHNLQRRLTSLGIPATFDFPRTGTHSWDYWHDNVIRSWPVLGSAIGGN